MKKLLPNGCDYLLEVPYKSEQNMEATVYEIKNDAERTAELKNCWMETDISKEGLEKSW